MFFKKYFRRKSYKKRFELSYVESELMKQTVSKSIDMFIEQMETEKKTGLSMQNYLRNKNSQVTKSMIKAVNVEYNHILNYSFDEEELIKKQLKRRNELFSMLKEFLLDREREERILLRDMFVSKLDYNVLKNRFTIDNVSNREFCAFDDFYNKYIEVFDIKNDVVSKDTAIVESNKKEEKEVKDLTPKIDVKPEEAKEMKEKVTVVKELKNKRKKGENVTLKEEKKDNVPPGQIDVFSSLNSSLNTQ